MHQLALQTSQTPAVKFDQNGPKSLAHLQNAFRSKKRKEKIFVLAQYT